MKLLTLAHFAEAKEIIQHFSLKPSSMQDWIYEHKNFILIITGEGIESSMLRTSYTIGKYSNIATVQNLGIAGSLMDQTELENIYSVKHVYGFRESPFYHSYPVGVSGLNLVSTFDRILNPDQCSPLKTMAHLVDRELWGIAKVCYEFKKPLTSFKLISDIAGTLGACEIVKEKKELYSKKLCEFCINYESEVPLAEEAKRTLPSEYYFTVTQERQFRDLSKKLSFYFDSSNIDQKLKDLRMNLDLSKQTPKDKTKILIENMRLWLCPHV